MRENRVRYTNHEKQIHEILYILKRLELLLFSITFQGNQLLIVFFPQRLSQNLETGPAKITHVWTTGKNIRLSTFNHILTELTVLKFNRLLLLSFVMTRDSVIRFTRDRYN